MCLHTRGECVLALLVDASGEPLDLSEEVGLCWIEALFFSRPLATESQLLLEHTQDTFVLCDGHLEILSVPLLVCKLRQNLQDTEHQSVFPLN